MIVLVCGGRYYRRGHTIILALDQLHAERGPITRVVHGAGGISDKTGGAWAVQNGVEPKSYPAKWNDLSHPDAVIRTRRDGSKYDALAGHRRNQEMLDKEQITLVLAAPGGTGTADMVRRARKAGIEVIEIEDRP